MAEELNIVMAQNLPAATGVSDNDMLLIVQGVSVKRVPPSLMRGKTGDPGPGAFLGVTATYIRWKQGVDGTWQNLMEIERLRGPRGEKPVFRKVGGTLQVKYEGEPDSAYLNIFDREELKLMFSDLTPAEVDQLRFHFSDFTDANKAELMRPALDAAADAKTATADMRQLRATVEEGVEAWESSYSSWQAKEQARQTEELKRIEEERRRKESETGRIVEERLRQRAEDDRKARELLREEQEGKREEATAKAILDTEEATGRLNALSDHRDEIRDGYWWRWDEETGEWYNTGEKARGDVMYATFDVDPATGELSMYTDPGYAGANFEVDENGFLSVII